MKCKCMVCGKLFDDGVLAGGFFYNADKPQIVDNIIQKQLKKNLFGKLEKMFVMMPVKENKERLARLKDGHYFLVINTDIDTRQHIWHMVQSAITYAYQKAYHKGIEKGIVRGVESVNERK